MDTIAPFRITVCGIEELAGHCATGASHVLSILDPDWPVPEAFGAFGEHEKLELRFNDIIEDTPGQVAPRREHVEQLLAFGRDLMAEPPKDAHLLVHCHAGISRSTASMALILAQGLPQVPGRAILAEVLRIREKAWPNLRIIEMGDSLLGRGGTLVAAAHEIYRRQLEIRPHLAEFMTNGGRAREVAAGSSPAAAP
ncbi:MAG: protein-tyrosine-phosphatase [Acetobacteraceae bacterium]